MKMLQKGRSMIEMLGVLAIIGVLSIGGIVLYRRAVNNHQANQILDDANRLAFVITERDNFAPNDNITNVEFNQTSAYSIVPFVGAKAGQYGIMIENVPKGVCEPLVDKANIEYKVRVAAYGAIEYLDQDTSTGLVYDSFHKDICVNDMNDVILYFGDTSGQCNKPDEGETYAKCKTNADCCGTYFCAFENASCSYKGKGKCRSIADYGSGIGNDTKTITVNNVTSTWIKSSSPMTWWSAQNWCERMGKSPTSRADLGCGDIAQAFCSYTGNVLTALRNAGWKSEPGLYWLEDCNNECSAYRVSFSDNRIGSNGRDIKIDGGGAGRYALCH